MPGTHALSALKDGCGTAIQSAAQMTSAIHEARSIEYLLISIIIVLAVALLAVIAVWVRDRSTMRASSAASWGPR